MASQGSETPCSTNHTKESDILAALADVAPGMSVAILVRPSGNPFDRDNVRQRAQQAADTALLQGFSILSKVEHSGQIDGKTAWHWLVFVERPKKREVERTTTVADLDRRQMASGEREEHAVDAESEPLYW